MKKYIAILLVLCLLLSLAACGGSKPAEAPAAEPVTPTAEPENTAEQETESEAPAWQSNQALADEFVFFGIPVSFDTPLNVFVDALTDAGWELIRNEPSYVYFVHGEIDHVMIYLVSDNSDYISSLNYCTGEIELPFGGTCNKSTFEEIIAIYGSDYKYWVNEAGVEFYIYESDVDRVSFEFWEDILVSVNVSRVENMQQENDNASAEANASETSSTMYDKLAVTLCGVEYVLPFPASELAANGWTFPDNDTNMLGQFPITAPDGCSIIEIYVQDNGNGPVVSGVVNYEVSDAIGYHGLQTTLSTSADAAALGTLIDDGNHGERHVFYSYDNEYNCVLTFVNDVFTNLELFYFGA